LKILRQGGKVSPSFLTTPLLFCQTLPISRASCSDEVAGRRPPCLVGMRNSLGSSHFTELRPSKFISTTSIPQPQSESTILSQLIKSNHCIPYSKNISPPLNNLKPEKPHSRPPQPFDLSPSFAPRTFPYPTSKHNSTAPTTKISFNIIQYNTSSFTKCITSRNLDGQIRFRNPVIRLQMI
jgi:hypothetical protein